MSDFIMELYLSKNEKTFEFDEDLPSLPVPNLHSSLLLYLDSIEFLVTDEEYKLAIESVKKFQVSIGNELQDYLVQKSKLTKNWLEDWWLEYAYLRNRASLIPFSNIFICNPSAEYWPLNLKNFEQVAYRCSLVIRYQIEFYKILKEQRLKPMFHKGAYWSMNQFKRVYNTCRLPGIEKDELKTKFMQTNSSYVIFFFNSHIFAMQVYDVKNDFIFSIQQIYEQIMFIITNQKYQKKGQSIACLTSLQRDDWYKYRNKLILDDQNKSLLNLIEESLFCFAFEDECPLNKKEIFDFTLSGDSSLRWADKSLTNVYFKNGAIGTISDHACYDGLTINLLNHYVTLNIKASKGIWPTDKTLHFNPEFNYATKNLVQVLKFNLDLSIQEEIHLAKQVYIENCSKIETLVKTFSGYGKKMIKKYQIHPEALIQIAICLAYYKLNFKFPNMNIQHPTCYCTASTRKFYNGRTETCRTFSKEFKEFSMYTIKNRRFDKKHVHLLNLAVNKFQVLMNSAMNAKGIDRHFLGLYLSALEKGLKIPDFFLYPVYTKFGPNLNYILSTSCSGYWDVSGGVPPMREDGYGIFYGIEDNQIHFTLLAYENCEQTNVVLMFNEINNALLDIQCILINSNL